jgi:hypothetical protein
MEHIAKALIDFQFKCPAIDKDSEVSVKTNGGGSYKFAYATFGNIVQTIKKPMFDARLGYTFYTTDSKFVCKIMHESGECIETSIDMPKFRDKMQENGSLLTYCKRYTLVLALGLDTDLDDDGNASDGNEAVITKSKFQPREATKSVEKFVDSGKAPEYTVPVGKFKGLKLKEIEHEKLKDYLNWLANQAKEKGQPLSGAWREFHQIGISYLEADIKDIDLDEVLK